MKIMIILNDGMERSFFFRFVTISLLVSLALDDPGANRYWTMWKLPMFGCTDPSQVLKEVAECRKAFPQCYVRLAAFDSIKQVQVISFLVQRPSTVAMAAMSGEKDMKVWNPINNKKFETFSYLPPLTDAQISKQVDMIIPKGLSPCLEFSARRTASLAARMPPALQGPSASGRG